MSDEKNLSQFEHDIREQGYSGICFWLPSRAVAGGTKILFTYAKYLSEHTDLHVYFVDYHDGASHDLCARGTSIQFIDYDPNADTLPLPEPVIVVVNSTRVVQIKNLPPQSKLLLWHWETVPCSWEVVLINHEARRLLKLAYENRALVYHDWSSRNIFKQQFGLDFQNRDYLQIRAESREYPSVREPLHKGQITIAWLGRLSVDKRYSLYNIMSHLARLKDPRPRRLIVIGDGVYRKEAEACAEKYKDKFETVFLGTVAHEELAACLSNMADIVFAVGTSVLEAAGCRLPAVICQMDTTPFTDDRHVLLCDTVEYCLGMTCEQARDFPGTFTPFAEIIRQVYSENGKERIGEKCYAYCRDRIGSLETICASLLRFAGQSSLTIEKLRTCIRYIPYNKLRVKDWSAFGVQVASVTIHGNVTTWRLFNLPIWKVNRGSRPRWYFLGVRVAKDERGVYSFPGTETHFTPGKANTEERYLAALYKREEHRRNMRERLARGEKLRVCLFCSRISCWCFDSLYRLLEASPSFIPTVVVDPFILQGHDAMVQYMNSTYEALSAKGYRVMRTYDENSGTFVNLRAELKPDILFYTESWFKFFQREFYIDRYFDRMSFLVDYFYPLSSNSNVQHSMELCRFVNRYFLANTDVSNLAKSVMKNIGRNIHVTGSPKLDPFFDSSYQPKDPWKPQNKPRKRIIWAPHHSDEFPDDLYQFNAFFDLYEDMFTIAEQYKDSIQIAFKPHPMLRPKLEAKWGKEESDAYFARWEELENGQYENGEFIDLFLTSDAMILDSISFIAEYTAVNKPALFTIGPKTRVKLNEFGRMNFELLYKTEGNLFKSICNFIENVVLKGMDSKKEAREAFIREYILPPNGKSATENIYDNLCEEIFE